MRTFSARTRRSQGERSELRRLGRQNVDRAEDSFRPRSYDLFGSLRDDRPRRRHLQLYAGHPVLVVPVQPWLHRKIPRKRAITTDPPSARSAKLVAYAGSRCSLPSFRFSPTASPFRRPTPLDGLLHSNICPTASRLYAADAPPRLRPPTLHSPLLHHLPFHLLSPSIRSRPCSRLPSTLPATSRRPRSLLIQSP
jgi:hypothetical protein